VFLLIEVKTCVVSFFFYFLFRIFTPLSGWGLVIPVFFLGGHLPQTSSFRSAKRILVASFTTWVRTRILSDRTIFCTLREGQQRQSLMPLGLFLFFFGYMVTCPRPPVFARPNKYVLQTFGQHKHYLQSVSVDSPTSS